jgi:hypothetical protein
MNYRSARLCFYSCSVLRYLYSKRGNTRSFLRIEYAKKKWSCKLSNLYQVFARNRLLNWQTLFVIMYDRAMVQRSLCWQWSISDQYQFICLAKATTVLRSYACIKYPFTSVYQANKFIKFGQLELDLLKNLRYVIDENTRAFSVASLD